MLSNFGFLLLRQGKLEEAHAHHDLVGTPYDLAPLLRQVARVQLDLAVLDDVRR